MPFVANDYLDSLDPDKREKFYGSHAFFGYQPETFDNLCIPDGDRYSGTYILGVQGSGKSGLLQNLILSNIAKGIPTIVFDMHGDTNSNCLATMHALRLDHAYLLDLEDETHPFSVNLFATGELETEVARTQAVDRIQHIFEVQFPKVMDQQNLPRYLRLATLVLLANPDSTLVSMYRFLTESAFRYQMLQNVTDPTVRQFWQAQYEDLSELERIRRVQPLTNRLESLFVGRSLVKNILGRPENSIDFRQAILNREHIFIRLPIRLMGQDASLIGTILLAQLHNAVFSFADLPPEQRPGVSVYIDEFQTVATEDIAELFTEGRKFGVKLCVAHQFRHQLPPYLQDSTMTARTKVCFQTTPEDAREMAHFFPSGETSVRPEDIEPHPVHYLLTYPSDDWHTKVFTETYLRPLQGDRRGNRVEIETGHLSPTLGDIFFTDGEHKNPRVPDPTPYLDSLLFDVMRTGNPRLPIPPDAVRGFANCGVGFYRPANRLSHNDPILTANVCFPSALVVPRQDGGLRWTRHPEGETEMLYHFIFHLRMVMRLLSEHPIGKATAASTSDVAKMLMALPRRAAFVRSGETVGVIYTHDTPKLPTEYQQAERIKLVREQTREKYCHPRAAVEAAMVGAATATPGDAALGQADDEMTQQNETPITPRSRWEEV